MLETENTTTVENKALERARRGALKSAESRRGKSRGPHPLTGDREYNDEEVAFLKAMSDFQSNSGRKFPTWTEILGVVKDMGYSRP